MAKKEKSKKVEFTSLTSSSVSSSVASSKLIKSHNRLLKRISDADWDSFNQLKTWHNETFPDKKMTFRKFFKLMNTYSPLIQSLMQLEPNDSPLQRIGVHTAIGLAPLWVKNIGNNVTRIKSEKDIKELFNIYKGKNKVALVVGAGPSLYDNASGTNHLDTIQKYAEDFDGIIIVVDRILQECLNRGIGDYFTVVDGSEVIKQFFDNDEVKLFNLRHDNQINLSDDLPDKSYNIKAFMATCTHQSVVDSWKGQIYFYVPTIPQEILPNASSLMCDFTGNTEINAGGNAGALAWSLAEWMGCKDVALCGMDYSFKITDDLTKTSNWAQFVRNTTPEEAMKNYKKGYNPDFNTPYLIDNIYAAFRTAFFNYTTEYNKHERYTYNCSEGGALHHESIKPMLLEEFLKSHLKK